MTGFRNLALVVGLAVGMVFATGSASAANFGSWTCHHGTVKAGTYSTLRIAGTCTLTDTGTVTVRHDLIIKRHATFNAVTAGTLHVRGDVWIKAHAIAGLGCSDELGCMSGLSHNTFGGNITAVRAAATVIHGAWIGGNVRILGGGGNMDCTATPILGMAPFYSTIHDSTVVGNVTVRRLHSCWFGVIRVHIGGNAKFIGGRFGDPDAMEIVTNVIGGNLGCFNNNPVAHVGDSMGAPNVVGGHKRGECAAPGL
jgi:hypothetical protein